jgi:hypothetical protein
LPDLLNQIPQDEWINARVFNSQVAELQILSALLNRFTQLGAPFTVAMP